MVMGSEAVGGEVIVSEIEDAGEFVVDIVR